MNTQVAPRSALIIQGPIVSRGNTGRGLGSGNPLIDDQHFDATETINQNIRENASIFDLIVVSSWESENTFGVLENEKVKIVKSKDVMLDREKFFKNNKYRQFYSLSKGLEVAREHNCSFIVKIRTDTALDAGKLLTLCKNQPGRIWVLPYVKPNFLGDFFFAGNLQNVTVLTQAILRKHSLYIRIHEDFFYSYLFQRSNWWEKIQVWNFFPRDKALSIRQAKLIESAWKKEYSPIPRSIWHGTVWRGFQFPSEFYQNDIDEVDHFSEWLNIQQRASVGFFRFSIYNFLLFVVGSSLGSKIDARFRRMN